MRPSGTMLQKRILSPLVVGKPSPATGCLWAGDGRLHASVEGPLSPAQRRLLQAGSGHGSCRAS